VFEVVREILKEGPDRIQDLIDLGVSFSSLDDGRISLGKEGGHSKRRVLHVKDITGKAIEDALLAAIANEGVHLFEHYFAIDLITAKKVRKLGVQVEGVDDRVLGLYFYDGLEEQVKTIASPAVLLATGGAGQTYLYTTNPSIATGDGVAIASRAGLASMNLEFIQFHPTTFHSQKGDRFLITEAVRGEGAKLIDGKGRAFLKKYHPLADLAPRDVVARAIDREMKRTGAPFVRLDTPSMDIDFPDRFPNVYKNCVNRGVNPSQMPVPVVPAAHYSCGGIPTELDCSTELDGLYACGEVACTGLHGANRLASNSLLEAVVLAYRGAEAVCQFLENQKEKTFQLPEWVDGDVAASDERVVLSHNLDELKRTMWDYVGIVRSTKRLERAQTRIRNLGREINEYYWNAKVEFSSVHVPTVLWIELFRHNPTSFFLIHPGYEITRLVHLMLQHPHPPTRAIEMFSLFDFQETDIPLLHHDKLELQLPITSYSPTGSPHVIQYRQPHHMHTVHLVQSNNQAPSEYHHKNNEQQEPQGPASEKG
jgi:L-aspartate oxidase